MIRIYESEQEQIDAIKNWWKQNGRFTLAMIVLAIVLSFGWRYWQGHRLEKSTNASVLYERLLISFANHDSNSFKQVANQLEKNYADTPYADLAALFSAKKAIDEGNLDLGQQQLQQAMKNGHLNYIRQVARIRLARLLLEKNQAQQALELVEKVDDKTYLGAIHLLKGDAYTALNQPEKAQQAYQEALTEVPASEPMHAIIQMKLEIIQ